MSILTSFDTLAYANRLKDAGVPVPQAEAQAGAIKEVLVSLAQDSLATKQDLQELSLATKQDLQELSLATKQDLQELSLATKQDIQEVRQEIADVRTELKNDIIILGSDFKHDLKNLELKLSTRMGLMLGGGVSILATLITILHLH